MNRTSNRPPGPETFTPIALFVFLTVVSVAVAMLFPLQDHGHRTARKKVADQDTREIVHAVEQYNVEYAQCPKLNPEAESTAGQKGDESAGDAVAGMKIHNAALFNTLRDIDRPPNARHAQNPRNAIFVQGRVVASTTAPKDGFLEVASRTGSQGSWYDPWGSEYNIVIDSNADDVIDVDSYYEDFEGINKPRVTVGAFSLGKDKKLGTGGNKKHRNGADYSDDLLSWFSR